MHDIVKLHILSYQTEHHKNTVFKLVQIVVKINLKEKKRKLIKKSYQAMLTFSNLLQKIPKLLLTCAYTPISVRPA